jgi:NADPH:quinone reductase-like Zn-dependent oxidoreductase
MKTMHALMLDGPGAPFRPVELPRPSAGPGEVLVRIAASGVTVLDTKIRAGAAGHARHPLPAVLGMEMAGTVVEIGAGVGHFRPGDEVYGMTGGIGGVPGSLAEYQAADARLLAKKPGTLSMREAAALPLNIITAWEGLIDRARLQAGQTVLVQGGAGGVGHLVLQLAVAFGGIPFATASAENAGFIAALGAQPIDYRAEATADYVTRLTDGRGFDLVYDTAGGASLDASFAAVARFGHVVTALGWGTHALAPLSFKGASYSGVFTLLPLLTGEGRAHHGEILAKAAALADAGKLRPRVDPRIFTFGEIEQAHEAVAGQTSQGKIVIDVESN